MELNRTAQVYPLLSNLRRLTMRKQLNVVLEATSTGDIIEPR